MNRQQKPYLIWVLIAVSLMTVFVLSPFGLRNSNRQRTNNGSSTNRTYTVDIVSEGPCQAGKTLHAVVNGKTIDSYTCDQFDSVVAWVKIEDLKTGLTVDKCKAYGTDDQANTYLTYAENRGRLTLIRLEKGYAVKPGSVSLRLEFSSKSEPSQDALIRLTKLSEPRIELPDSAIPAIEAESVAKATFTAGPNIVTYQLSKPLGPEERLRAQVIGITDCLANPQNEGEENLPPSLVAAYGRQSSTIKVKLDRLRFEKNSSLLTYHNAEIMGAGASARLRFPTTQSIGNLGGSPAQIKSSQRINSQNGVLIELGEPIHAQLGRLNPYGRPSFSLAKISPSVEDLDLPSLLIRVKYPKDAHPSKQIPADYMKTFKSTKGPVAVDQARKLDLSFTFNEEHPVVLASDTLILPLHHRIKGPILNFIPAPSLQSATPNNNPKRFRQ